jgi:hypothetical protein
MKEYEMGVTYRKHGGIGIFGRLYSEVIGISQ